MRIAYNLILFSFALQIFAYLGQVFNIFYPFNFGVNTSTPFLGIFNIDLITVAIVGSGAVAIGIGAILTRSGTYALYALLVFGIGVLISQVQPFIMAIPNLLKLIPFPNFPGTDISTAVPIMGFLTGLIIYAWGWFLIEMITQRVHT